VRQTHQITVGTRRIDHDEIERPLDGVSSDWIVVRNRLSMLGSRNKQLVADGLNDLSLRLGFRSIDGFAERVVYREFFPRGLTALDDLDEATLGTRPNMGHVTAREEVTSLLRQLKLPLDERGRRRAANRAEWFTQVDKPLELHDSLGAEKSWAPKTLTVSRYWNPRGTIGGEPRFHHAFT